MLGNVREQRQSLKGSSEQREQRAKGARAREQAARAGAKSREQEQERRIREQEHRGAEEQRSRSAGVQEREEQEQEHRSRGVGAAQCVCAIGASAMLVALRSAVEQALHRIASYSVTHGSTMSVSRRTKMTTMFTSLSATPVITQMFAEWPHHPGHSKAQ